MPLADIEPVQISPAEKSAKLIVDEVNNFLNNATRSQAFIYDTLWRTDADPQDVCDILGTEAGQLFEDGQILVEMINRQRDGTSSEILPGNYVPPRAATINPDGTVTLAPA